MTHDDRETGVRSDDSDLPPDTALWKKITSETEMLRLRTTPMHVQQRILSSLPEPPAKTQQRKAISKISPALVGVIVVALLIGGLLLGMVLRVQ